MKKQRKNNVAISLDEKLIRSAVIRYLADLPPLENISKDFEREYLIHSIRSVFQMKYKINSPKSASDLAYQASYMLYKEVLFDSCVESATDIECRINKLKKEFRTFAL